MLIVNKHCSIFTNLYEKRTLGKVPKVSAEYLWGGGGTWLNFCWVCASLVLPLRAPTPLYSILWPIADPILVTFWKICNFRDPKSVTFYIYELNHFFNWMKKTLLFTYSTNILVRLLTVNMKNCLTPKTPKMCDPILVTLLKMRPHYSQSSHQNATTSSGTFPLTSYLLLKKVTPPPGLNRGFTVPPHGTLW